MNPSIYPSPDQTNPTQMWWHVQIFDETAILSNERVSSGVINNHVLNDILKRATYAESGERRHAVGPIV